ncbi:TRAF-type zinc finger domain-containing protein 1-like isoform X2 [Hetaerina americana]|uniref:TRAF-type zinc finger domain-containing protein 1-like isoform X2 n=1 Tax=Hetaerina americana TaxID=62018 RepID=UPI003A7F14E4
MADDDTYCVNCKRDIPSVNFVMHSMHCARNITLCTICEEPVPRSEMDAHQAEFHSPKDCESCGEKLDVSQLTEHKANSCPMRRVNCSICELELPASEIGEHENYCGSRTERCDDCGEYVMLKYQKLHLESNHGFLKLDDEPGPTPSWQSNERVVVNGTFNNDLRSSRRPPNTAAFAAARVPNFVSPSTSKRTNDMPQVNSIPPPHASKSVFKPSIMGEMDRPLRNNSMGDQIDSDVAALFSDNLHLAKPPSYHRAAASSGLSGAEEDLVALPCEFCEALVPANQLILHQTACRPDLVRYEEPTAASLLNAQSTATTDAKHSRINSMAPSYKIHNSTIPASSSPPQPLVSRRDFSSGAKEETLLPCEFCHESFSVSKLYEHQMQCNQTSWRDGYNERPEMNYTFNGRSDAYDSAPLHSLPKSSGGFATSSQNVEKALYESIHKEDLREKCTLRNRLQNEAKVTRDLKRHSLKNEYFMPMLTRGSGKPSIFASRASSTTSEDLENDEGRKALLRQAQMIEQINVQLGLKKESSTSQRSTAINGISIEKGLTSSTHKNDQRRPYMKNEWTMPQSGIVGRSGSSPSTDRGNLVGLDDLEDERTQALRVEARDMMVAQMHGHSGLMKKSSTPQRNHVYSELSSWMPCARKQPNHFTSPPSSSHNLGSYPSPASYSQSGRGGRTTGAIPKQKTKSIKKYRAPPPPSK